MKNIFKVSGLFLFVIALSTMAYNDANARGRRGSHRVGGYNSHGKGSHYVGGR